MMTVTHERTNSTANRKVLQLLIEVPGIWADDLQATADEWGNELVDTLADEMRLDVGLTIVTLPGEKCLNDDFAITSHVGRVVDASVRDAGR